MNQALSDRGYFHAQELISSELAAYCSTQLQLLQATYALKNNGLGVDKSVVNDVRFPNAFSWYASQCSESLLIYLLPKIEAIVGCKLYPSYSYSRIYFQGSFLRRHTDRLGSEYAVSICLEKDPTSWGLCLKGFDEREVSLDLDVGDACIYFGSKVEHWRTEFEGSRQIQIFLFYVEQAGEFAEFRYDKRPFVGASKASRRA